MEGCKDIREKLSLYIDDMLDERESRMLEEHIKSCEDCRTELEILREMVESCRSLEEKEPPGHLQPMVSGALRKASRGAAISGLSKRWLKPGLVSVAAVLLLVVAAKGIMPGLFMGSRSSQDMAATEEAAPAEMYSITADGEAGFGMAQNKQVADSRMLDLEEEAAGLAGAETPGAEPGMPVDGDTFSAAGVLPEPGDGILKERDSRKIIRNAEISIQVEDFNRQLEAIQKMVDETGGYIESSNSYIRKHGTTEDDRDFMEGNVVIRIPSPEFTGCLERISGLGKVTNRSTDGSDITLRYMDTEARLKSLEVQQDRLLEILERATEVEDILKIETELNRVRSELERHATQLRGWDNLVQYSTIRIFMTEVDPKDTHVSTLQVGSLWDRMKRGFIRTTNAIMDMIEYIIVGIGYALPVMVLVGAGLLVWWRLKIKNMK
jgi:hypothetical protein